MGLLLQHIDGPCDGIDGLSVVSDSCLKVSTLGITHGGCRGLIFVPAADVLLELTDAICELVNADTSLLDASAQRLHLRITFLDLRVLVGLIFVPAADVLL